jgi:hypothetical protein
MAMTKRVLVFVLLAVLLDQGIGRIMEAMYRRTFTGERGGLLNYALAQRADVLILGSSRAQYQVMPSILREQLSMTAFNAGLKGHDFLYSVMLLDLWQRRHGTPRVVLLQVDIESLLARSSELEAAQIFAPYLDESPRVREILYSADPFKRFQYLSRAYRYNGRAFSVARNLFATTDARFDGFVPAHGRLNPATDRMVGNALDQDGTAAQQAQRPFSARKEEYLKAMAGELAGRGGRLILFHTPLYSQDREAHGVWSSRLRAAIAELPAIDFIDICETTHPQVFAGRPSLYNDINHLNAEGARIYTTMLAAQLKPRVDRASHSNTAHAATGLNTRAAR